VNDQMLILEIRILVLRHGKQKVLRALASVGDQTIQQIEQQLAAIENAKKAPRRKATREIPVQGRCRACVDPRSSENSARRTTSTGLSAC
jgi:hypothetical protein